MTRYRTILAVVGFAVGLTFIFWQPLWTGGGLIGGDIYTYYLPQKTFYADRLQAGEFPLWNNRVGHGYPILGESQTGACYPPYLLAYRLLDINTAYNAIHLLHYLLAFLFTFLYARRIGLGIWGGLLAGVVFTYGWFPARSCWEWAIVTGAWLPAALWCLESFLQSSRWRYLIALSGALGLQLLAGHYNLAFITHVVIAAYLPLRLWFCPSGVADGIVKRRIACVALCGICLIAGFSLAAVQLLPSWELKQNSQRAVVGGVSERLSGTGYDPGYGHLPPMYLTQIFLPWDWYPLAATGELDGVLGRLQAGAIDSNTNQIEAHLYFGMIPIALILLGLGWRFIGRAPEPRLLKETGVLTPRMIAMWLLIGLAAIIYATGWLLPITRHLPGFSFFTGPGRFGIVATLAAALIAASILDRLLATFKQPVVAALVATALIGGTIYDLHWVSRQVTNAYLVQHPPIEERENSQITKLLAQQDQPPRLFAPGANLATLTGAASTPVYLGIGPAAYFDEQLRMPSLPEVQNEGLILPAAPGQVEWLQRAGVTHVLSFKPLDLDHWPAELVYSGPDRMLNPAWARRTGEPLYLYRLMETRGRLVLSSQEQQAIGGRDQELGGRDQEMGGRDPQLGGRGSRRAEGTKRSRTSGSAGASPSQRTVNLTKYSANRVVIETNTDAPERLILTDLMYPGWNVIIDGQPAKPLTADGMYRAVDLPAGKHQVVWSYQPASVYWGAAISLAALILLAAVGHIRYWRYRKS